MPKTSFRSTYARSIGDLEIAGSARRRGTPGQSLGFRPPWRGAGRRFGGCVHSASGVDSERHMSDHRASRDSAALAQGTRKSSRFPSGCAYIVVSCTSRGHTRKGDHLMATTRKRAQKHFQLDSIKIKRAQKLLRADTETEAIERALDLVIAEHGKSRLTLAANDRFVKSGVDIKDVYGTLED